MSNPVRPAVRSLQTTRYALILVVAWTVTIIASLVLSLILKQQEVLEVARTQARSAFDKDVLYRRWNALHGGVYVPVTNDTPPNPYLEVPEREITTPSGVVLTKVNPGLYDPPSL